MNNVKSTIIAQDKWDLKSLIREEMKINGPKCDLNYIDVSQVKDMSYMFYKSEFNGNISNWNVSNVEDMSQMFYESKFNGNISKWDTSNMRHMYEMFERSEFDGDISNWDVSNVEDMSYMFYDTKFSGDTSNWQPINAYLIDFIFDKSHAPIPYWAIYDNKNEREIAINAYILEKELNYNNTLAKKIKI